MSAYLIVLMHSAAASSSLLGCGDGEKRRAGALTWPRSRSRRQTVFYTPDTLTVSAGQKITGQLSCAPNARNNRDLDITIAYKVEGGEEDRKSTRLNSSHSGESRMPSSA